MKGSYLFGVLLILLACVPYAFAQLPADFSEYGYDQYKTRTAYDTEGGLFHGFVGHQNAVYQLQDFGLNDIGDYLESYSDQSYLVCDVSTHAGREILMVNDTDLYMFSSTGAILETYGLNELLAKPACIDFDNDGYDEIIMIRRDTEGVETMTALTRSGSFLTPFAQEPVPSAVNDSVVYSPMTCTEDAVYPFCIVANNESMMWYEYDGILEFRNGVNWLPLFDNDGELVSPLILPAYTDDNSTATHYAYAAFENQLVRFGLSPTFGIVSFDNISLPSDIYEISPILPASLGNRNISENDLKNYGNATMVLASSSAYVVQFFPEFNHTTTHVDINCVGGTRGCDVIFTDRDNDGLLELVYSEALVNSFGPSSEYIGRLRGAEWNQTALTLSTAWSTTIYQQTMGIASSACSTSQSEYLLRASVAYDEEDDDDVDYFLSVWNQCISGGGWGNRYGYNGINGPLEIILNTTGTDYTPAWRNTTNTPASGNVNAQGGNAQVPIFADINDDNYLDMLWGTTIYANNLTATFMTAFTYSVEDVSGRAPANLCLPANNCTLISGTSIPYYVSADSTNFNVWLSCAGESTTMYSSINSNVTLNCTYTTVENATTQFWASESVQENLVEIDVNVQANVTMETPAENASNASNASAIITTPEDLEETLDMVLGTQDEGLSDVTISTVVDSQGNTQYVISEDGLLADAGSLARSLLRILISLFLPILLIVILVAFIARGRSRR